jgi:hypothetical protein
MRRAQVDPASSKGGVLWLALWAPQTPLAPTRASRRTLARGWILMLRNHLFTIACGSLSTGQQ